MVFIYCIIHCKFSTMNNNYNTILIIAHSKLFSQISAEMNLLTFAKLINIYQGTEHQALGRGVFGYHFCQRKSQKLTFE